MRASLCLCVGTLILLAATIATAQDAVPWARSIEEAQQIAKQQGRLVLLHFYGDNCPPCRALEANVFPKPEFARAVTSNYVPVKINGSQQRELAMKYGVDRWPVDVVLAADGTPLTKPAVCPQDSNKYLGMLDQIAAQHRVRHDPNVQLAQNIAYDPPSSTPSYSPPAPSNYDPYAPRSQANTPDPRMANAPMQPQLPSQPQAGAYDPRGYQPQIGQQPQRESVDLNSSFQPAGAPAYGQSPAYGDLRASQPMQAQPSHASAPPMYGQNNQGQNGPAVYGAAVYGAGGEQTPAIDSRREVRLSDAPHTGAGYGQPALPPRQETQNQQWQSNPTVAGAPGTSIALSTDYSPRQPVAPPQQEIRSDVSVTAAPTSNPPLGLEGFCPVSLTEQSKWTKGDVRYGAIHRGRTYLFVSQAEQQRFLGNPDKYSPMLSGYDPVKYLEEGVLVEGNRKHGMMHEGRMYLFADETSLQRMWNAPQDRQKQLANAVQHAMQQSVTPVVRR